MGTEKLDVAFIKQAANAAESVPVQEEKKDEVPVNPSPQKPDPKETVTKPQPMPVHPHTIPTDEFGWRPVPSMRPIPILVRDKPDGGREYKTCIIGIIEDMNNYLDLISLIESLTQEDSLTAYYHTPGGNALVGLRLYEAFRACKGSTHGVIVESAASAGAMSISGMDTIEMGPYSFFMYHWSSQNIGGHSMNVEQVTNAWNQYLDKYARETVSRGLITEEEYTSMRESCSDVYVTKQQMIIRTDGTPPQFSGD